MFERTIVGSLRPYMKDILGTTAGCYKLDETLARVANWYLATIKIQMQIQIQIQSGLPNVSLKVCKHALKSYQVRYVGFRSKFW